MIVIFRLSQAQRNEIFESSAEQMEQLFLKKLRCFTVDPQVFDMGIGFKKAQRRIRHLRAAPHKYFEIGQILALVEEVCSPRILADVNL